MRRRTIWRAAVLAGCLVPGLPLDAFGQMERGDTFVDVDAGAEVRFYNDYDEKLSNAGGGVTRLLTNWLAIGAGGRLAKTSPSVYGSLTCLLNIKPGRQKTIPFIRAGAGTTGRDGAGQMWFSEMGIRYCFDKSIAASTCLFAGENFRYRSRHYSYTSVGARLYLSIRRSSW